MPDEESDDTSEVKCRSGETFLGQVHRSMATPVQHSARFQVCARRSSASTAWPSTPMSLALSIATDPPACWQKRSRGSRRKPANPEILHAVFQMKSENLATLCGLEGDELHGLGPTSVGWAGSHRAHARASPKGRRRDPGTRSSDRGRLEG